MACGRADPHASTAEPSGADVAGNFPRAAGRELRHRGDRACVDMGPTDGLITIMERPGPVSKDPPRPAVMRLQPKPGPFECVPANLEHEMVTFRDYGRIIYAFVALGARGPVHAAESILNSLRVASGVR